MAPHEMADRSVRGIIISTLLILISIVICISVVVVGIDASCAETIETWLPYYPGAEVREVRHDMFRARAMGNTLVVLHTQDDLRRVDRWYVDLRNRLTRDNMPPGLARVVHTVRREASSTVIYLHSQCAYN